MNSGILFAGLVKNENPFFPSHVRLDKHWLSMKTMEIHREKLGEPDIAIAGLQIWVHGRQFPDQEDYWDGNWLNVTVHCGAKGSSVWTSGNIIQLHEIAHLSAGAKDLYNYLKGKAELPCIEPELFV